MSHGSPLLSILTLLVAAGALAPQARGETPAAVAACLAKVTLDKVNTDGGCINKIVEAGPEAIAQLREHLDLTAVQPEMHIVPPKDRLKREPTGEVDLQVQLTNRSTKVALVRTRAINLTVRVSFQTFGFTWDGGASASVQPRVARQQIHEIVPLLSDETRTIVFRIPVDMPLRGRYVFDYTLDYLGPLAIPQNEEPGWVTTGQFNVDYLETSGRAANQRPLGDASIRLTAPEPEPVVSPGEPIPVELWVENLLPTSVTLPSADSYFASPYWFVIVETDRTSDKILARGNVILMEQMVPERTSEEVSIKRLATRETIQVSGSMLTRLPPGTYSGFLGCTVFRESGGRELWIGESATKDFTFTILE